MAGIDLNRQLHEFQEEFARAAPTGRVALYKSWELPVPATYVIA
jgi:hypothetical protein